jgi:hypothetical protein
VRTFVIGDVHGRADLLFDLLLHTGLLNDQLRIIDGVEVIQLGDLGDYTAKSATGDEKTWELAQRLGIRVLWGNHEWALFSEKHWYKGIVQPTPKTKALINEMKPVFALAREGQLLTHAGLHPHYAPSLNFATGAAEILAKMINTAWENETAMGIIDDVHAIRGGGTDSLRGGILWRDSREPLARVTQVFGHSASSLVRAYNDETSLCIDAGSKRTGNLVGVFLDDHVIHAVGPDMDALEQYPPYVPGPGGQVL